MNHLMRCSMALGAACAAIGAAGCGTEADSASAIGTTSGALNYLNGCPAGYPNTALTFDTQTTQCSTSGDWDHTGIISPRTFFTSDTGIYFAAECGLASNNHHYVVGISARTDFNRPHSAKCATELHQVGAPVSRRYLSRANAQGGGIDDGSSPSFDWDYGAIKAECGYHQVVTGVAQLESNEIDAISCSPADVRTGIGPSTCNTVPFNHQDHCGQSCSGSSDWAYGYYKNVCRSDQYVKGVSKRGPYGEISAILCCNWS